MNKKFYVIISMVLILIGIAIFESIYAQNTINYLKSGLNDMQIEISNYIDQEKNSDITIIKTSNDLLSYWKGRESVLCLIYNHNDMKDIGKELTQLKSYLVQSNMEESYAHIDMALLQIESLTHIIEINLQNIL